MRGQASTRGFPNCAMSLSVIDRFASAINTGHQALATLYSSPSLSYSLPSTDHPRTFSLRCLSLSLFIPLTTEPSSTAFIVVICVCFPLSFSLSPSPPPLSLSRYVPSSLLSVSLSVNEERKTLTFKRASEGEHGALSTLSRYSPSHLVSLALPSSPLATRYRPVFSTAAFKL